MRKSILLGIILIFTLCTCNAKQLEINDFSCMVGNEKISVGDSLFNHKNICNLNDYSIKKIGQMEYKQYIVSWGEIYVSNYSDEYTIFGIILNSSNIEIVDGIKVGFTKKQVLNRLGNPQNSYNQNLYYYNDDFDVLELKLSFDDKDILTQIQFFMGT